MKKIMIILVVGFALSACFIGKSFADIYIWGDSRGVAHVSEQYPISGQYGRFSNPYGQYGY